MDQIPGYEVGGPIGFGAGGAALAVRGRDGRSLAAVVIPSDERLARIESLRDLRHPHLPRIRDLVPVDDDVAVVMDLVVGPSLAALVNARTWLATGEVATLWHALADALAALHSRGLVHGDVSPANVIIGPGGNPVLVDVLGHGGRERGHTGYVPPELDDGPATTASDVWSLARTLTWASGEDSEVVRHAGTALAEDPGQRPSARDFQTWSFLLGDADTLDVPPAADLAGAHLRSAVAPTVLTGNQARRGSRWPLVAGAVVALLIVLFMAGRAVGTSGAFRAAQPEPARAMAVREAPTPAQARGVVEALVADRDAALGALDQEALESLYRTGSRAGAVDAALVGTLSAEGTRLAGYGTDVLDLEVTSATSRAFAARVELRQREHERLGPEGSREVVEVQGAHCVLVEVVDRDGWVIDDLSPCPDPDA